MARRVFRSGSRPRRPNIWGGSVQTPEVVQTAGTTAFITLISNASIQNRTSPTLVRMRGRIFIRSTTAGESASGSMGIIVVEETARAAGTGSMPNPGVDFSAPWMWWGSWTTRLADRFVEYLVDSKSQRKIKDSEAVVLILRNPSSFNSRWVTGIRFLLKD